MSSCFALSEIWKAASRETGTLNGPMLHRLISDYTAYKQSPFSACLGDRLFNSSARHYHRCK
jgi:hypothetical protein